VAGRRATPERLGAFSDGVFAVIITIMVLDLKAATPADACGSPLSVSRCIELCGQLPIHRHRLGESSSSAAVRRACDATPGLGELRAPVHGVAGTILDGVGREYSTGGGSGVRVCSGICAGELGVSPIRAGVAGSGRSRGDLGPDAADHASAIVADVGNVRDCDVTVTQVSFVGFWAGVLRFACLSPAGSSWG
jgi:Endosomal/lysosomal potassium channel TMEM175